MRSPVAERGRVCRKISRSWKLGITFSMPTTEIKTSGRVRHMRPLPSDSTMHMPPESAIRKLPPEMATLMRRYFSRRYSRAASGEVYWLIA